MIVAAISTVAGILLVAVGAVVGYIFAKRAADRGLLPQYRTWRPYWVPLTVLIDDQLTEEVIAALRWAIDFWNEELGFTAYNNLGGITRVGSYITVVPKTDGKVATTKLKFDHEDGMITYAGVEVRQDVFAELSELKKWQCMAHELGHALGLDHDADPVSVMYPKLQDMRPCVTDKDKVLLRRVYRP